MWGGTQTDQRRQADFDLKQAERNGADPQAIETLRATAKAAAAKEAEAKGK
jgi:hypothetical protein